jgi:hypothetical protein
MLGKITSKLRMPDGSINPWVIAVTVTVATFTKVQGGHLCTEAAICL